MKFSKHETLLQGHICQDLSSQTIKKKPPNKVGQNSSFQQTLNQTQKHVRDSLAEDAGLGFFCRLSCVLNIARS